MPPWLLLLAKPAWTLLKWAFGNIAPTFAGFLGLPDLKKLAAQASVYYGVFLGICLFLKLGWLSPLYAGVFMVVPIVGRTVERINAGIAATQPAVPTTGVVS